VKKSTLTDRTDGIRSEKVPSHRSHRWD